MPPKRRQRADPFEDAKDAVNNTTSMNERDRHQLFATSLLELSTTQTCELTEMCIDAAWNTGITLAITSLSVEDIAERSILDYIVSRPNLDEETKVDILTLFLLKNCSVNITRLATPEDDSRYFVCAGENLKVVWKDEILGFDYDESETVIHFVQTVISHGLALVLGRILPKLGKVALRLALVESIGSNSKKCYEVLIRRKDKIIEFELEAFAALLAAKYGRTELLSTLLDDASETALEILRMDRRIPYGGKFSKHVPKLKYSSSMSRQISFLDHAVCRNGQTILELSARKNQPDCVKLIVKKGLLATFDGQDHLLKHCVKSNFNDCANLLLKAFDSISFGTVVTLLNDLLQSGTNTELCLAVIDKMHQVDDEERDEEEEYAFHFIFELCFKNRWFGGLFILASNSATVIRSSNEMRKSAGRTLNALVLGDYGKSATDIIKHLILIPGIDLLPSFEHVVLRSEDIELVEFYLSLNFKTVVEAAHKLKSRVKNEPIKKMLEDSEMKVKVEAVEEAQGGKKNSLKKKK